MEGTFTTDGRGRRQTTSSNSRSSWTNSSATLSLTEVNSYLAGYNFHRARQTQDESVDEFISRCRVLAAKCKFADILEVNTRLIEQLIVGTKHVAVQEKLLEKGDALANLDAALDIARTYEATKAHVAQLQATPATAEVVHDVGTRKPKRQDGSCTR